MPRPMKRRKTTETNSASAHDQKAPPDDFNAPIQQPESQSRIITATAYVGPGQKSYTIPRQLLSLSSTLFRTGAQPFLKKQHLLFYLPNINALDFEDYVLWLSSRSLPLPASRANKQRIFASCIRLFNLGYELGDARLQCACVEEVLRASGPKGCLPHEDLLRDLMPETVMMRLIVDLYLVFYSRERFERGGGLLPLDFLRGLCGGLVGYREDTVKKGNAREDRGLNVLPDFDKACTWHVHDELFPMDECEEAAKEDGKESLPPQEVAGVSARGSEAGTQKWRDQHQAPLPQTTIPQMHSPQRSLPLRPSFVQHNTGGAPYQTNPRQAELHLNNPPRTRDLEEDNPQEQKATCLHDSVVPLHAIQYKGEVEKPPFSEQEPAHHRLFSKDILLQEAIRRRSQLMRDLNTAKKDDDHSKAWRLRNQEIPKVEAQIDRFGEELMLQRQSHSLPQQQYNLRVQDHTYHPGQHHHSDYFQSKPP